MTLSTESQIQKAVKWWAKKQHNPRARYKLSISCWEVSFQFYRNWLLLL